MGYPAPERAPLPAGPAAAPSMPPQAQLASPPPGTTVRRVRTWPAMLTLFVLAAVIPESILTFNTPPVAYLTSPLDIVFLPAFYGSADLLIRELLRRRRLSWGGVLVLGAAFGGINEGIIAGTWYRVAPTGYTLLGGVDWGWAVALTVFHMTFSVALPIFLVESIFPQVADRPWLRRRGIVICCVLLALCTLLGVLAPTYRAYRLAVLLGVVLLALLGAHLRARPRVGAPSARHVPRLWSLRVIGCVGMVLYFASIYLVPAVVGHFATTRSGLLVAQAVDILVITSVFALGASIVRAWADRAGWGQRQTQALIAGTFVLTTVLSVLLPAPRAEGEPLFTLPFVGLLVWLAWRGARQRPTFTRANAQAGTAPDVPNWSASPPAVRH